MDKEQLVAGLKTGFISKDFRSNTAMRPSLLVNDKRREKKILSALSEELSACTSFDFSVAFINSDGLASIKELLSELEAKGIKGRILTTNYLNFTEPSALREIIDFSNIELRAYTKGGFHPKGYIFTHKDYYSIIIGSANLTASALSMNQEWSVRFVSDEDGEITSSIRDEFERVWNEAEIADDEWINSYEIQYENERLSLPESLKEDEASYSAAPSYEVVPNSMQKEAMESIHELRERGEDRALLIAATGTGKTYLSIFDVKQMRPRKVLYIAHRDMILEKAKESYDSLLCNIHSGLLNGNNHDYSADYLFASIFTLVKDDVLKHFKRDEFDYIIIDEVHHAGANSYKKILSYFTPKFLLGLTATPERSDGEDIFKLFNYNVPYEIRLKRAMEEDLLCPFHYYGLTDLTVNGEVIDDKSDFSKLVSQERVKHISKAMRRYRNFSHPVKGLIFCSRQDEARELSGALNEEGFVTTYLLGDSSSDERERVIERLESDDDPLEYIITVDIFNEGVDIPAINQVVMLRPTASSIIFTQQLGRGLRKYNGKSYVSVIDFIGNYQNNFFIPIALFGDNSYSKDNLRKALSAGSSIIPGSSTVQINEIARDQIFKSINDTNFKQLKFLREEFSKLERRLGRVPSMIDFTDNGFIDPLLFIDYAGSYYEFLLKLDKEKEELSANHRTSLQFVSLEFGHGLRVHELLILDVLKDRAEISISEFKEFLKCYSVEYSYKDIEGMCNTLSSSFYTAPDIKKYGKLNYVYLSGDYIKRSDDYSALLESSLYKSYLADTLSYGLKRARLNGDERYVDHNLVLYRKYSRKDVCKLLNWKENITAQNIGGYIVQKQNDEITCPVFITYKKSSDISESINYEDYFIDNSQLHWMSKNKRTSSSPDVSEIINQSRNNIQIPLFVKKSDNEGSDFYYLGPMKELSYKDTKMKANGELVNVVNVIFSIDNPLPHNLYNYLES